MEYFKNDAMARDSIGKDIKWEPHVSKFVELYNDSFPIHNIIDVGANFGYHTLFFSKNVAENGFVYAFEPQIQNFNLLYKNIKVNDIDNVILHNKACSDINDVVKMPMIKKDSGIVNMGDMTVNWIDTSQLYCDVESIMLDDIKFPEISLIKLDVQGWESKVLNGAKKLIKKYKPTLIVEFEHYQFMRVKDGGTCDDLAKLIKDMGYNIFYLEYEYPSDHICIHDDNLKEFNEQFGNYILPHTERNDVNDNISFTNKKIKLDYKE
jgi:FkbM family methyltransferase